MEPQEATLSVLFIYACGETESSEAFCGGWQKVHAAIVKICRGAKKEKLASACTEPGGHPEPGGSPGATGTPRCRLLRGDQAQPQELLLLPGDHFLLRDSEKAVHFPGLTESRCLQEVI